MALPQRTGPRPLSLLFRYELRKNLFSPFAAMALVLLVLGLYFIGGIYGAEFLLNGHAVAPEKRVIYSLAFFHAQLSLLASLFTLALCAARLGPAHASAEEILLLTRALRRRDFLLARFLGIAASSLLFWGLCLLSFYVVMLWKTGVNLHALLWLFFPQGLGLLTLAAAYFALRAHLGNLSALFALLALLPLLYAVNLYHLYAGLGETGLLRGMMLVLFPQFGTLHALSLGWVQDFFARPGAVLGLWSVGAWGLVYGAYALWRFERERL